MKNKSQPEEPILITAKQVANLVGMSCRNWWRKVSSGLTPKSIKIGHSVRWNRQEIEEWIKAGCPCRHEWEEMKEDFD